MSNVHHPPSDHDRCRSVPDLERVCYHIGQLLGPREFIDEHDFFANKLSLIVSRLLGHGVVCGLEVDATFDPSDACTPDGQDPLERLTVTIQPGLAVDADGQLLVVRHALVLPVWPALPVADRERATTGGPGGVRAPLFVSLRFTELALGCIRPLSSDGCAPVGRHQPTRARECVGAEVTLDPPHHSVCDGCCDGVGDPRELLAVIAQARIEPNELVLYVDETVRRPFGPVRLTTITGITWAHGGTYGPDEADALLEGGFALRFSAPVQAETLSDPQLVEVGVYSGGSGNRDDFDPRTVRVESGDVDDDGLTRELWIRVEGYDRLSEGDTVRIAVHCDFVLDRCCRAVDGEHVGGRVPPWLPDTSPFDEWEPIEPREWPTAPETRRNPPTRRGPWESGNGSPGGTFRSWIRVAARNEGGRS